MAVVFHDPDDECAPFPHRVVVREDAALIICAECDHWILRRVTNCQCKQKCHELGELLAKLGSDAVPS